MSKDLKKTIHAFEEGDRLAVRTVRDSSEFQHGGFVRTQTGKYSAVTSRTSFDVIAAALAKSGSVGEQSHSESGHRRGEGTWVMVCSNGTQISAASAVSVRINEYATEMLKDPEKVQEFFKRVNGDATAN